MARKATIADYLRPMLGPRTKRPVYKEIGDLMLRGVGEPPPPEAGYMDRAMWALGQPGVMPIGMTAWHGTPHKFAPTPKNPLGEFDLSKIGTGEGAQVYGHGIYLAENPQVADEYARALGVQPSVRHRGTEVWRGPGGVEGKGRYKPETENAPDWARYMGMAGGYKKAVSVTKKEIQKLEDQLARSLPLNMSSMTESIQRSLDNKRTALADLMKHGKEAEFDRGMRRYKVDLPDEAVGRMLDWDAPLSRDVLDRLTPEAMGLKWKQHEKYGGFVNAQNRPIGPMFKGVTAEQARAKWAHELARSTTGQQFYERLGLTKPEASEALRNAGIPGLKYLDQGSRGAGKGTRNFVVWDTDLLNILGAE